MFYQYNLHVFALAQHPGATHYEKHYTKSILLLRCSQSLNKSLTYKCTAGSTNCTVIDLQNLLIYFRRKTFNMTEKKNVLYVLILAVPYSDQYHSAMQIILAIEMN